MATNNDDGYGKASDYENGNPYGLINVKHATPRVQKMKWDAAADRKLLLLGLGKEISKNEYEKVATMFIEKPTGKAIQERLQKLRHEQLRLLNQLGLVGPTTTIHLANPPSTSTPTPTLTPLTIGPAPPSAAPKKRKQTSPGDNDSVASSLKKQKVQHPVVNGTPDPSSAVSTPPSREGDAIEALLTLAAGVGSPNTTAAHDFAVSTTTTPTEGEEASPAPSSSGGKGKQAVKKVRFNPLTKAIDSEDDDDFEQTADIEAMKRLSKKVGTKVRTNAGMKLVLGHSIKLSYSKTKELEERRRLENAAKAASEKGSEDEWVEVDGAAGGE